MRPLVDLPFSQRCVVAVVTVLAILLLLFALDRFVQAAPQAAPEVHLFDRETNIKLLELDRRALDEAYHNQLVKLFGIWLTDGAREAIRFTNGLSIARVAYDQAAQQIAKREQELQQRSPSP